MNPTILAVDDNEIHCYAMVKILENAGYNVLHTSSGSTALTMTFEHRPDAVLLDINLPDVNGFEVCTRLKADPETRNIPVIFHTASDATSGAQVHAEMVGAAAFLTYPIYSEHLLTVLKGTLAKKSRATQEKSRTSQG